MMLKSLKQKIAKVGIGLFCAGCVFLSSAAYSQAASYTAYALKLNKTNNFTSMHAKTTSDDYITNEVTAITNTSYANFWAVNNSKSKISNKYKQGVGTGSCNLIFTKSGYNSTNTQVGMGMENYQSQLSTAFVSGNGHSAHRTQPPTVHYSMTKIPTAGPTKRCVRTAYTHITTPLRNS